MKAIGKVFSSNRRGTNKRKSDRAKTSVNLKELSPPEKDIILNTLELKDKDAREIMVPRVDVSMIAVNSTYESIISKVSKWGLTRLPVYDGKVDDIIGVLYVKDLIGKQGRSRFNLKRILHEPYFLPESKSVLELLRDFRERRIHIGMVVDEYGGFSGIVTLEDVLEQIVGEIHDEYDTDDDVIKQNEDGSFLIDSRTRIEDVNEMLSVNLPTKEADTIGGFLFNHLGRLPKRNEKVSYRTYFFTVVGKSGNIVTRIRFERKKSRKATEKQAADAATKQETNLETQTSETAESNSNG